MACEYKVNSNQYITEIKDIAKDKIISIDFMKREEEVFKVIYLKPTIKVILKDKNGKQFVGEATCNKNDHFDVEKEYLIAKNRADIKKKQHKLKELCK